MRDTIEQAWLCVPSADNGRYVENGYPLASHVFSIPNRDLFVEKVFKTLLGFVFFKKKHRTCSHTLTRDPCTSGMCDIVWLFSRDFISGFRFGVSHWNAPF